MVETKDNGGMDEDFELGKGERDGPVKLRGREGGIEGGERDEGWIGTDEEWGGRMCPGVDLGAWERHRESM